MLPLLTQPSPQPKQRWPCTRLGIREEWHHGGTLPRRQAAEVVQVGPGRERRAALGAARVRQVVQHLFPRWRQVGGAGPDEQGRAGQGRAMHLYVLQASAQVLLATSQKCASINCWPFAGWPQGLQQMPSRTNLAEGIGAQSEQGGAAQGGERDAGRAFEKAISLQMREGMQSPE